METPQVDTTDNIQDLEDIQSGEQRTQTITVTSRQVAVGEDTEPVELTKLVKVFVRPLPFRRWFLAIQYVKAILGAFPQMTLDVTDKHQLGIFAAELLGNAQQEIIGLVALATDRDEAFFDTIDLDEGLKIILAVIEVNKDFFVQKVLPLATEVAPQIKEAMQETFGETQ